MDLKDIKKDCLSFEESRNIIYNHDIYKKDLSLGMALSWPILRKNADKINIAFFTYPNTPSPTAPKDTVSRPLYWILMNSISGVLSLFTDCRLYDFVDTNAFPFTERTEGLKNVSIKEYREAQAELAKSYDELRLFAFKNKNELNTYEIQVIENYKKAFSKITPPGHVSFYKSLGKEFFEWLGL